MIPESVHAAIDFVSNAVWGPWTMALLLGTGIFLTVRLRFVQVVRFPDAVNEVLPGGDHTIVVGEIQGGEAHDGTPLLYFRGQYHKLG